MKRAFLFVCAVTLCGSVSATEIIEAVVARVGDRVVTRSQYAKRLSDGLEETTRTTPPDEDVAARKARFEEGLLDVMIEELLIKDRADRLGMSVTPKELTEAVERLKKQYGLVSDAEFEKSLLDSGLSRAEMEARMKDTLITNKVFGRELRSRSEATDKELRERYQREKEQYRIPERARVSEIIVLLPQTPAAGAIAAIEARANEAASRARAGEDFKNLVATYSEAPSKDTGGDLGVINRGDMRARLDTAVFSSAAPAIIGPVRTDIGFHILNLSERLPSEVPGFDSIKERLRKEADEETFQRDLRAYLERLRKETFVDIHTDMIPKTSS